MTSEIEQHFFEVFGIEPLKLFSARMGINPDAVIYPEITSDILLQILCIVVDEYEHSGHTFYIDATNIEELKSDILDALMGCIDVTCDLFDDRVKEVRQLFKEGE